MDRLDNGPNAVLERSSLTQQLFQLTGELSSCAALACAREWLSEAFAWHESDGSGAQNLHNVLNYGVMQLVSNTYSHPITASTASVASTSTEHAHVAWLVDSDLQPIAAPPGHAATHDMADVAFWYDAWRNLHLARIVRDVILPDDVVTAQDAILAELETLRTHRLPTNGAPTASDGCTVYQFFQHLWSFGTRMTPDAPAEHDAAPPRLPIDAWLTHHMMRHMMI